MKYTHSFEHCYSLLNISTDCSWDDLRKSYRQLIQKWHPDRFSDENEKAEATNKLKDLNTAYSQLSSYYQENGVMPFSTVHKEQVEETITTDIKVEEENNSARAKETKPDIHEVIQRRKNQHKSQTLIYSFVLIAAVIIVSQNLDSTINAITTYLDEAEQYNKSLKYRNETIDTQKNENKIKKTTDISPNEVIKEKKYFTLGSSIAEVVMIQGPPERTEGDIWYYGNSEIHFSEGLVQYWYRTPDNPLKAKMVIPTNK